MSSVLDKVTSRSIGMAGMIAIFGAIQIGGVMRRADWTRLLVVEGWLWSFIPMAFMGVMGWVTLYFAKTNENMTASRVLKIVATIYFVISTAISYDIAAFGNSTSGIAFFLFPGISALVLLPLIAVVVIFVEKLAPSSYDD